MRKLLSGGLIMVAAVSGPAALSPRRSPEVARHDYQKDPRLSPLQTFFRKMECPAAEYAVEFLTVADQYALDWRLLPSLSFIESTCGKMGNHNNLFGWDSGRARFESPAVAIRSVGSHLGTYELYRAKSLDKILATYNPNRDYARKVKSVMTRISAVQ